MSPAWRKRRDALSTKLIARWEGCRLAPYLCTGGYWTIGIGHVVCQNGRMLTAKDQKPVWRLASVEEAEELFRQDLPKYTRIVDKALSGLRMASQGYPTPEQSAALTSFAFNLGEGNLRSSTLLRKVLAQDWEAVPKQFERWIYSGGRKTRGLLLRRQAEARMFMSGLEPFATLEKRATLWQQLWRK